MGDKAAKYIERSRAALEDCGDTLGRLSATCCVPGRSDKMNDTFAILRDAMHELQYGKKTPESLAGCKEHVAACGSQIGNLYVTCCTEVREPLYQRILKQLNLAHSSLATAAKQAK